MNRTPDCLPEAILDRFDVILEARTVAVGALQALKHGNTQRVVESEYEQHETRPFTRAISIRRMASLCKLLDAQVPDKTAAQMIFGGSGDAVLASLAAQEVTA